ncbi:MAG TPA: gamma-glutamylcyclotransferase [Sphingomonadaceae bacterium]|nr:gamma-glutamylcyclotransferase [Sphingomonadaceae bacterium]
MRTRLRLTPDHIAYVHRDIPDPGPLLLEGFRPAEDADYAAEIERLLAIAPTPDDIWVFGYGSLIWNPCYPFTEQRTALAHGWHRSFTLGWDFRFRGTTQTPGLMLAIDRGGQCKGVVHHLAPETARQHLDALIRREMSMVPTAFPGRWISVKTEAGPVWALTFAMDRHSPRYIGGLSPDATADVLASACGFKGSMAQYLHATVLKLEELGIHDRYLWQLQALVADRIDAARAKKGNADA